MMIKRAANCSPSDEAYSHLPANHVTLSGVLDAGLHGAWTVWYRAVLHSYYITGCSTVRVQ